jgi:hypothetical protein
MRTQIPAPSPNNLPSRTATAGDTGLRSRKIVEMLTGDAKKLCDLGFGPASRWNHILPQQSARMDRTTTRITFSNMNHDDLFTIYFGWYRLQAPWLVFLVNMY